MTKKISELVVVVGSDIKEALEGLDQVAVGAKRLGRSMERTGRGLTRNVTAPILGVGAAGFTMASDLESSFAKMEGLVGVQREQLDDWMGDVRGMATEYGVSASKAADALFFITSAGLEGDDAMQALEASIKANVAGLGEIEVVADLATSAMNAYGSDVLSASDATDVLTAAVREGKLAPEELSGAMGKVIPVASSMGVRFDEVGAAMAAMSRTGTNAAEGATQLRSIMTSLLKPTADAEGALADMGLSAEGLRDQIREQGLLATLQTLDDRFDGNVEATAAVFGNVRALSGVMDMMGEGADTTAEIFGELENSTGSLDTAFGAMSDTAKFQLNQAMREAADLLIEIGEAVLPVVVEILEATSAAIKPVAQWFGDLDPRIQKVTVAVGALVAAIGPLLVIAGKLVSAFGTVAGALSGVAVGSAAPIVLAIAALGSLVAAGVAVHQNWDVLSYEAGRLADSVKAAFEVFRNAVKTRLDAVTQRFDAFAEPLAKLMESVRSTNEAIGEFFAVLAMKVLDAVEAMATGIFRWLVDELVPLAGRVWDQALQPVVEFFEDVRTKNVQIVTDMIDKIFSVFSVGLDKVVGVVTGGLDKVKGAFQAASDILVGNSIVPDLEEKIVDHFAIMADGMVIESVRGTTDSVGAFDEMDGKLSDVAARETGAVTDVFAQFGVDVPNIVGDMVGEVESIWGRLDGILTNPLDKLKSLKENWFDFFAELADALKSFWNVTKGFLDKLGDFFSSLFGSGSGIGQLGGGMDMPITGPEGGQITMVNVSFDTAVIVQAIDRTLVALENLTNVIGHQMQLIAASLGELQQIRFVNQEIRFFSESIADTIRSALSGTAGGASLSMATVSGPAAGGGLRVEGGLHFNFPGITQGDPRQIARESYRELKQLMGDDLARDDRLLRKSALQR